MRGPVYTDSSLVATSRLPRFLAPLGNRQFALLWSGQTVSRLGDGAYQAVLTWTVYAISRSTVDAGYVLMAYSIPQLAFLLAGGLVGDRFSRRAVILVSDILSGSAVGAVAVLAVLGRLSVLWLAVLAAIFGMVSAFFGPAYQALIPEVVPEEQLQAANGLRGLSLSASQIVGPSLGAALYLWGRAAAAFGFDALSFFTSAITTVFVHVPPKPLNLQRSIRQDIQEGYGYVRRTTWLWVSIAVATIVNAIGMSPLLVLLPAILRHLHLGVAYMGLTFTISGITAVLGNILLAQMPRLKRRGLVLYSGWTLLTAAPILIGLAPSYAVVALAAVVFGVGIASESIWQGLVQEHVPREYLSRVFSLDMLGSFALQPLGFAGAGLVASVVGPSETLIAGGVVGLALNLVGLTLPAIRRLD